jgi:glycerol-3-phosphate acyltransferase PlsX
LRIGIDLMGSDNSPKVLFEGVLRASVELHSITFFVICTHSAMRELKTADTPANIQFYPVKDAITMSEEPLQAVSRKKESSIVTGIRLLKKKQIDAFVSAGNTGALLASATLQIPRLPGIKRPALLVSLPTVTGSVAVLDVGGNVSCKAQHLVQFAHMGAAYQSCSEGIEKPKVGLLNIGVEPKKGTSSIREAYQMLASLSDEKMHFLGNVEGRDVFQGKTDVLVTDGFTGNVLLKTAEGVSSFIFDHVQEMMKETSSIALEQPLQNLQRYFSYTEYPGAFICGIEGIVMKCHGNSSARAMLVSIRGAAHLVEKKVISHLKARLTAI